ncbi:MAG: DoxX family protein [Mycobacterium sp.]
MTTQLDAQLNARTPLALGVFRIVVGLLFLLHGTSKLLGWPGGPQVPFGTWPYWYAGVIEVVVGLLVAIGLFTRLAALVGAGQMAVAYFWQHIPTDFWPINNQGEPAVLFCFALLLLAFAGPGALAVSRR